MNDLEREVRDTLLRHQDDAPSFDTSEAHRVAGRAHRRQVRNVVIGGIAGIATVIVAFAGLGGLVRADRPPIVLDRPPSSPMCVVKPGPDEAEIYGWPDRTRNPAGVYSWDGPPSSAFIGEGFMHNGYKPGSGAVNILVKGVPGRLIPHRGQTSVTVAGCAGTYRRFVRDDGWPGISGPSEEWMLDIRGTTVTITLIAERPSRNDPGAREVEVVEAHEIIESIRAERWDNALGFRLIFTLATNTWDSG